MSHDTLEGTITAAQLRAARALLRLPAELLAEIAGVSLATIRRAEAPDGTTRMTRANAATLRRALEDGGIEFIPVNGDGGVGVRFKFKCASD